MTDQIEAIVTHYRNANLTELRAAGRINHVSAVYGPAGERIASRMEGEAFHYDDGRPVPAQVIADALAPSWPGMRVCVWLDLSVQPAERLADNVVPPDAIGST